MSRRAALVVLLCALVLVVGGVVAARQAGAEWVLASFTTDLSNRSEAQRANILTSLARLDGHVVPPNTTFSFNGVVGQRLIEAGYERAPGYAEGGVADTTGGGICQLSSTVYNAALLAGMRIVERAPHARRVLSVGPGRDATVVYGRWDLRFANPYVFPVKLRARAVGDRLVVEVVGTRPLPQPVEVRVEQLRETDGVKVVTWRKIGDVESQASVDVYAR